MPLLWASTGGGWRAMFADIGYANVFQQAGLLAPDFSRFDGVSTTSGGSWFSTQFFYSQEFYNRTALAESPDEIEAFVLQWMATYLNISSTIDNATLATCDTSELEENYDPDPDQDYLTVFREMCYLLVKYDNDWALFVQGMLEAASVDYGDATFVDRLALPENRIPAMQQTDLLVQAALAPNSRIRDTNSTTADSVAVYLGYDNSNDKSNNEENRAQLFTVPLSAAYVVENDAAGFVWGFEDRTNNLQTYLTTTPADYSWSDWEDFYLYPGDSGTIVINNSQVGATKPGGTFQTPFGGTSATTVLQIAAISSAAGGSGSPLIPSVYTQMFSIGYYEINEAKVETVWRVVVGCAAGLGAGILGALVVGYFGHKWDLWREQATAHKAGILSGLCLGAAVGLLTGFFYGTGSILVPNIYDEGVGGVYKNNTFDNLAVCSQWPNSCGEQDGFLIDGWFIDNPALVINVGQYQKKQRNTTSSNTTSNNNVPLKAIITNTNEVWNTTFNRAQLLQYFATYFNEDVAPGDFVWAPGYFAPFRSPQIFQEYLDEDGLDALLEPIEGSNMTTALMKGTTVDNPSFGVVAGLSVEILLLNSNANIPTLVIGQQAVEEYTQPLANMTREIAASPELVQRVRDFVGS